MGKNCLNCTYREVVYDCSVENGAKPTIRTGRARNRCALDKDMTVNGRMHCERWSGTVTVEDFGRMVMVDVMPRNVQELIKM